MVVGHVGLPDLEPLRAALAAPLDPDLVSDHRAHGSAPRVGLSQRSLAERQDLLPPVDRLLLPIGRAVVVEEAVAGAVVAMELVRLTVLIGVSIVRVHLVGGWCLVFV